MIPFARISTYGNRLPTFNVKKLLTPSPFQSNGTFLVLYEDGNLYGIGGGTNLNYYFGNGSSTTNYTTWQLIMTNVKNVWCNDYFSIILQKNDNTFWYCGNPSFMTGSTSSTAVTTYTECTSFITAGIGAANIDNIKDLQPSFGGLYLQLNNGSFYRSGANTNGQLGTGGASSLTALTLLSGYTLSKFVVLTNSLWLFKTDGTVWRCGQNSAGQLGVGNTNALYTLTQYSSTLYDIINVGGNSAATFALMKAKSGGSLTVFSCGNSFNGNIANGSTTNTTVTSFGTTTFSSLLTESSTFVSASSSNTYVGMIIQNGSTLYKTGVGTYGNNGTGSLANLTRFTAMSTVTGTVKLVSMSSVLSAYISSDGKLMYAGNSPSASTGSGSFIELTLPQASIS